MLNMNDDGVNIIINSLCEKGFFRRVSRFFFLADFNEKMNVAVRLIRYYFQTDKLDDIAYDIVKSYCLSDDYNLEGIGIIEDTDQRFNAFFEEYMQPFGNMVRCVEARSRSGKK